ncbi:hypothetical protein BJ165DRAFT_1492441, partial [Panaeolus papilionaceus]
MALRFFVCSCSTIPLPPYVLSILNQVAFFFVYIFFSQKKSVTITYTYRYYLPISS